MIARRLTRFFASRWGLILSGAIIGILASLLQYAGNPPNMGICSVGFVRDIAGALGLHRAGAAQYMRPEIIGLILGAALAALAFREFKPHAAPTSFTYLVLGACATIGGLVFQGCALRALLRLAGGDLNAIVGLAGFATGVIGGVQFLKAGYTPGRSYRIPAAAGWVMPGAAIGLLLLRIFRPQFSFGGAVFFSTLGTGSMHAAVWLSLGVGLLVGFVGQRSRFCTMGAVRDVVLMRETGLLGGLVGLAGAAFAVNLLLGQVHLGFADQPVAQSQHLWNFLGMVLVGMASALAGGCPVRQIVLAGEGNGNAAIFVLGMVAGAALTHNLNLAQPCVEDAMPVTVSPAGMVAVVMGLAICLVIGFGLREKIEHAE